jgi:hypothetical protein
MYGVRTHLLSELPRFGGTDLFGLSRRAEAREEPRRDATTAIATDPPEPAAPRSTSIVVPRKDERSSRGTSTEGDQDHTERSDE